VTLGVSKTQVTVSEVMHNPESDDAKAHVLGSFEVSLHWWVESEARTALLHSKARSHTFPDVFELLSGLLKLLSSRGRGSNGGGSGSEGAHRPAQGPPGPLDVAAHAGPAAAAAQSEAREGQDAASAAGAGGAEGGREAWGSEGQCQAAAPAAGQALAAAVVEKGEE
jgi:hypothetical protein